MVKKIQESKMQSRLDRAAAFAEVLLAVRATG